MLHYSRLAQARHRSLGLLVLDEPRQQETRHSSLSEFVRRLGADADGGQIIYATSESPDVLAPLLEGTQHILIDAAGDHLLRLAEGDHG